MFLTDKYHIILVMTYGFSCLSQNGRTNDGRKL